MENIVYPHEEASSSLLSSTYFVVIGRVDGAIAPGVVQAVMLRSQRPHAPSENGKLERRQEFSIRFLIVAFSRPAP